MAMAMATMTAAIRRPRRIRVHIISILVILLSFAGVAPVAADGVNQASDISMAASFGGNELTFVIRQPARVPGQLRIDVVAHTPVRAATLTLVPVPLVGAPQAVGDRAVLTLAPGQGGSSSVLVSVDRTGPYELRVSASASAGGSGNASAGTGADTNADTARLPFRVLTSQAASWEKVAYPAFLSSGVFLLGVFGAAAAGRRRWLWPTAVAAVVAGTVAFTTALLSPGMPAMTAAGASGEKLLTNGDGTIANGRPFAQVALTTVPAAPVAGSEFALHIGLTDGATGAPVGDLMVHHGALAHTVVTSADLRYFAHVHPVPVAPGDLLLRLNLPQPGRYLVQTEIERTDSGAQVLSADFTVGGQPGPAADPVVLDTSQESQVVLDPPRPVAGVPTSLTLHAGTVSAPHSDLQGWLGMAGHMIVRRPGDDYFGHVHETASMAAVAVPGAAVPDETVGRYGPWLHFVYIFPAPGRYRLWIQYERDFRIHTAALAVDVAGGSP